jgi:hypothetical protein
MFLEKKEDIAFFNRVIDDNRDLEPYFTELAIWAWIYQRDKYLELIEECRAQNENGTVDIVVSALQNMELEPLNISHFETIQEEI